MNFVGSVLAECFKPRDTESTADWVRMYFYSHTGEAFSEQQSPWVTAPQGPCWALDNVQFRTIWLQWAARMFKTNICLATLMRSMDQRPEETMFATPDETNCKSVFGRFWKMIEHCPRLRNQAPSILRQSKTQIKLKRSVCHGAWPRGKSRLADKSIRVGVANEIDKWTVESTSTEGDPLQRFMKRGAEYPDRKFVLESTPSVRGRSAVESGRLSSTNHRYHVPCPNCHKFQTLEFGDGDGRPGCIQWEKDANGNSDIDTARRTAHYVCLHCSGIIHDIHRPWMVNRGVWVPAGCDVDHEKAMDARNLAPDDMSWLRGAPKNWGSDYGSQISVFYALFHGWGDIVADFLKKKGRPRDLQQWINEDKGETWEAKRSKTTPERVGERLKTQLQRGIVPEWGRLLTVTIDQQAAEGGYRLWVVLAHGDDFRAHVVDYGVSLTLEEVWNGQIRATWQHLDGGNPMVAHAAAADSGWDTKRTYDFCNSHAGMLPCKGSSTDLGGQPYRLNEVQDGENKGQVLWTVNTDYWETDLQARLDDRQPGEAEALSLCQGAERDVEFLEHLCNATLADRVDNRGNAKLLWIKKNDNTPNDFRDALRYGLALAHTYVVENGGFPIRSDIQTSKKAVINAGDKRPDGRSWHE
jgi:phage terminase large subunit GpA-like protein